MVINLRSGDKLKELILTVRGFSRGLSKVTHTESDIPSSVV